MPEPTLLDRLREADLLTAEQIAELAALPEAVDPDPKPLARVILQRGWLTRFQLSQAAAGKGKELSVGPYLLLDKLGEGGMGAVFKARHRQMKRTVALKLIRKEKLASPDAVSRFYQEVEAAAQLHHPNIVLAFDAGQAGTAHFFSMEYVEGSDLTRLVKEKGPLPVAEACEYARQAAVGLQHAHKRGLVHRDVKPSNLLLSTAEGEAVVKILDLGLARLGESFARERNLTRMGQVMGTPDYIAPEQALDARNVDIRADIYSLGCTLYFLLAGRPPFHAESLTELLMKHQMEEPASIRSLRPDVPEELETLLQRMMAKKAADRPATPAEVAAALEPFAVGGAAGRMAGAVSTAPAPSDTWAGLTGAGDEVAPRRSGVAKRDRTEVAAGEAPRGSRMQETGGKRGSRTPLVAGAAAAGVVVLGLVVAAVVWATRPGPGKQVGTALAQADPEKGKKKPEQVAGATPKQEGPKAPPPPVIKEPKKTAPIVAQPKTAPQNEERTFKGHTGAVYGVAFSPDGRRLLSGGEDGTARIWDRNTGQSLHVLSGHPKPVRGVAFSPDGKRVATCGDDLTVRLWDVESGKLIGPFNGHTGILKTVEFSPDGRRLLSCGDDFTMRLWDVDLRCELRHFDHPSWVRRAAFSPDARYAFTTCADGACRVWSLETGREYRRLSAGGDQYTGTFLRDGRRVLSGSHDKSLRLWDVATGKLLHHIGPGASIWGVAGSPNARFALSCGQDGTTRLWDLARGAEVGRYLVNSRGNPDVAADGKYALCGGEDSLLHLWHLPAEVAGAEPAGPLVPVRPLPGAEALAAAEKQVHERFEAEYKAKGTAERIALAKSLLRLGRETADAPALCYVYLREARDVAAGAGALGVSHEAVDDLSFLFAADELAGRGEALKAAARSAAAPRTDVASAALDLLDDAVSADRYNLADAALTIAKNALLKAKPGDLTRRLARAATRLATLGKKYAGVRKDAETLAARPGDAEASLALGRFECFQKEDWIKGLRLLATGSDSSLAALARKDLANPPEPKGQADVGLGWWKQAEKQTGLTQRRIRRRARDHFERALPQLDDLDRVAVENVLKKVIGRTTYRPGLVGTYFADEGATKKVLTRRDYTIGFNWGPGSPAPEVPADNFSARWGGWLLAPQKGKYTLFLWADDGAKVFLEGKCVLDNWSKGGRITADVSLLARPYRLEVEYHESGGYAAMVFGLVDNGVDRPIPMEWLYHDEAQEKLLAK